MKKPCKFAEGIEGEWECTCYHKIDCEYQDVDYNYIDYTTGHKEINVVNCTKPQKDNILEPFDRLIASMNEDTRPIDYDKLREIQKQDQQKLKEMGEKGYVYLSPVGRKRVSR